MGQKYSLQCLKGGSRFWVGRVRCDTIVPHFCLRCAPYWKRVGDPTMWLDVAILPYSAASQGPFDLGCPKVTESLFRVHLLPSVMTHLPFRSWWVWCPVVCLLCNSFLRSSKVSASRCVLCSACKSATNLAGCWTEKIQARRVASYFSKAEVVTGQANCHLCLGKSPAML